MIGLTRENGGLKIMNKVDLVELVAEKARLTKKDATVAVDEVFEGMVEALARGEEVRIAGFGSVVVKERKPRQGVNPSTGEKMTIPAAKVVGFKAAKALKDRVK